MPCFCVSETPSHLFPSTLRVSCPTSTNSMATFLLLLLLLSSLSPLPLVSASNPVFFASFAAPNPFTAKAATLRYWTRTLPNSPNRPSFLLSKLSPLSALDSATFSSTSSLSSHLPAFCAAARLLCSPSPTPSLASHPSDSHFTSYQSPNFTNYGAGHPGGSDSFKNYSDDSNVPTDTFRSYSRNGVGHDASFTHYSPEGNVVTDNFTSYASAATGGTSTFTNYDPNANVPDLQFTNYAAGSNGHVPTFTTYSSDTNSGGQSFSSYGKHGNGLPTSFTSYANNSNVINSGFSGYSENGNAAADTFSSYGANGNVPENTFRNYGESGTSGVETFASYRDQSNVGDDKFTSYAKSGLAATASFTGYGDSFNPGSDSFKGYGEGATNPKVTFKSYSSDKTTFKSYAKSGVTFKSYKNASVVPSGTGSIAAAISVSHTMHHMSRWVVEPGKFFRESSLKKGTRMPMPDIRDKMPMRSFLPRSIAARIPFTAVDVRRVFNIPADSAMGKAAGDTVADCSRAPSRGETKRCAASAEDMFDFAAAVIGGGAAPRSTESARGSGGEIVIGNVRGVDGGKVTKAVSCHQSLFPYLVYYCHSVPKVRVYEAEILAVDSREKINHGVAICHVDTSDWAAGHGAFVALGEGPGRIEVCHWIFEGDMTWTVSDGK